MVTLARWTTTERAAKRGKLAKKVSRAVHYDGGPTTMKDPSRRRASLEGSRLDRQDKVSVPY
jgi:hypothetical protein